MRKHAAAAYRANRAWRVCHRARLASPAGGDCWA